jgi:hypothetical protein
VRRRVGHVTAHTNPSAATIDYRIGIAFQPTDEGKRGIRRSYRRCSIRSRKCRTSRLSSGRPATQWASDARTGYVLSLLIRYWGASREAWWTYPLTFVSEVPFLMMTPLTPASLGIPPDVVTNLECFRHRASHSGSACPSLVIAHKESPARMSEASFSGKLSLIP